jgi:hypothetical protein
LRDDAFTRHTKDRLSGWRTRSNGRHLSGNDSQDI